MANVQGLKDFYKWATTVPETKPMVYAPPVNKQSSDVGVSFGGYSKPANTTPKTTTPAKTSTPQGDWYDINKVPRPSGGATQTPKDWEEANNVIKPTEPQTIYVTQQDDTTRWLQEMKEAAKTEGPCENSDLEDDSDNDNEAIE